MPRRFLMLVLLFPLAMGCGDTWGRQSAVEVPLHRDLMGIEPESESCPVRGDKWKKLCSEKNYHKYCPPGCSPWIPHGKE
jgi:hypothetical protein